MRCGACLGSTLDGAGPDWERLGLVVSVIGALLGGVSLLSGVTPMTGCRAVCRGVKARQRIR